MGDKKAQGMVMAVAAAALAAGVAAPSYSQDTLGQSPAVLAQTLKDRIYDTIGSRIPTATPADLEGSIIFVINQGRYDDAAIDAALTALVADDSSPNLLTAVTAVREALAKNKRRGTAAIFGSGGGGEFSSPAISGAGGSAGYTQN